MHWNSDTQGDTTTGPDLTCVSTLPVVMRQVQSLLWWSGDSWLGVELTLPGSVGLSPGCQVPHAHQPYHVIVSLSSWSSCPLLHPDSWIRPSYVLSWAQWGLAHGCVGSSAIPPVLSAWLALVSSLYWPPVQPQFLSESPLRTHLAAPWGWSIGFLPLSSSICCGPFPGIVPALAECP